MGRWFRKPNMVPPGGKFFFLVEATGTRLEAASRRGPNGIIEVVRRHMQSNQVPVPPDLESQIEDYICRNVPESFCDGDADPRQRRFLSMRQIWEYTRLLFKQKVGALRYVDRATAERRAAVCVNGLHGQGCPLHNRSMCTDCHGLKGRAARELTPGLRSDYDDVLGVCTGCGCMLESKIHIDRRDLDVRSDDYPDEVRGFCWLFAEDAKNADQSK